MAAAAPDLSTLLDFESAIQPVVSARLTELAVAKVAQRLGTGTLESGRVDVELVMGAATGHLYVPDNFPGGQVDTRHCLEDAWNASFNLNVITVRDLNGALHAAYRAAVREAMTLYFSTFTVELLPLHAISMLRTGGTRPNLVTSKEEDVSQMTYPCVISVRPSAWPAPY